MAMPITEQISEEQLREEKRTARVVLGGSLAEGLIACVAIVLAIAGFLAVEPQLYLSMAIIVLGAAVFLDAAPESLRFYNLMPKPSQQRRRIEEIGIETTVESLVVAVAITCGILAVLGVRPMMLVPSAVIMIGGCMVLGAFSNAQLTSLITIRTQQHPSSQDLTRQIVIAIAWVQAIVGLCAMGLGILALSGIEPIALCLLAILGMSISALLSGSALSERMHSIFGY